MSGAAWSPAYWDSGHCSPLPPPTYLSSWIIAWRIGAKEQRNQAAAARDMAGRHRLTPRSVIAVALAAAA